MDFFTPCYVVDLDRLSKNLDKISIFQKRTNCKVLLALKGFSTPGVLSVILEHLDGLSASGAFEALLGKELRAFVSTFAPVYPEETFSVVAQNSDIVVFNSERQFRELAPIARQSKASCGMRINPQYSELPEDHGANPCRRYSHLGVLKGDMPPPADFGPGAIEGIHLHTMCAQYADSMERTIRVLTERYDPFLRNISWLNLGGGQLYGADDYDMDLAVRSVNALRKRYPFDLFAEPCEGVLTQCGFLVTRVLDIVHNDMEIAVLDSSAICHLSDAVYRGWSRNVLGGGEPGEYAHTVRLAGCSCYAGDIFGDYSFPKPLRTGDIVVFEDAAVYSATKACMFNGIPLPKTAVYSQAGGFQMQNRPDYEVFRQTL